MKHFDEAKSLPGHDVDVSIWQPDSLTMIFEEREGGRIEVFLRYCLFFRSIWFPAGLANSTLLSSGNNSAQGLKTYMKLCNSSTLICKQAICIERGRRSYAKRHGTM
jgi:hypothetical protein